MAYDMEDFFLKYCTARHSDVIGTHIHFRNYSTPFLAEDHKDAPASALWRWPGQGVPLVLPRRTSILFYTVSVSGQTSSTTEGEGGDVCRILYRRKAIGYDRPEVGSR